MKTTQKSTSPRLSCIILACDSHLNKGNSLFHCLLSVLLQDYDSFEVIVVENSHKKSTHTINQLQRKINQWNLNRSHPISYTLVNNQDSVTYGKARNIGAQQAQGEVLVFTDDDTIIADRHAFAVIDQLSQQFDFGFGAQRLWTEPNYFNSHSLEIMEEMEKGNYSLLRSHSDKPSPYFRSNSSAITLGNTFIANFGFCRKAAFDDVSGFPDFPYHGFEDDSLMFRLYEKEYTFTLLKPLPVVHVTHLLPPNLKTNLVHYFTQLIQHGYYLFHLELLFTSQRPKRELVLEKLKTLHYDGRIEKAFQKYQNRWPLNLQHASTEVQQSWTTHNRLSHIEFAQALDRLQKSDNVDHFVKNSSGDFDSLAAFIDIAKKDKIITVRNNGKINRSFKFRFAVAPPRSTLCTPDFKPTSALNQFPCDEASRVRRKRLLKSRYPFAEYLRFALIGDDDLISLKFTNDYWAWPVVLEKDKKITDLIRETSSRFSVHEIDVIDTAQIDTLPKVQTFITDPPYALHGSLAFINAGLRMLNFDSTTKEFYVILNPMMLGKHMSTIQKVLSAAGVYLDSTISNFSHYPFPPHFDEKRRADSFLSGIKLSQSGVRYSSSSNLYIFKTAVPVIHKIEHYIDYSRLYTHYL